MRTIVLVSFLLLAACEPSDPAKRPGYDQCMRHDYFLQCMAALPKGPERVHNSNDWDEVVDSCEKASRYQSARVRSQVKPECFAEPY